MFGKGVVLFCFGFFNADAITWFSILYIEISFDCCAMRSHAAYDNRYYMVVAFSFFKNF